MEVDMKAKSFIVFCEGHAALLVGSALSLLVGCGDVNTFSLDPGHIDRDSVGLDHACFDGSAVELVRYSSACGRMSKSLASVVHAGVVFPAEQVETLEAPCADGPAPAIEVYFDMEDHSIFFNFLAEGDRFPRGGFDGYMLDIELDESNGVLLAAMIDDELSTLDRDDGHIEWDRSHITVNFEGARYDQESLLKLDLIFARTSPLPAP